MIQIKKYFYHFDPLSFDPLSFDPGSFDPLSVNRSSVYIYVQVEYEYSMDPESDENSIDLRLPGEIENNFNQRLNDMFTKHQGLIYSKKIY